MNVADAPRSQMRRLVHAAGRLLSSPQYRGETWLRVRRPRLLFQPFGVTAEDRADPIFSFVARALEGRGRSILSFGCSTGEEVVTLRRHFPGARITGIDINAGSVAVCRKRLAADPDIVFKHSDSTKGEDDEGFDAIFCLSVLRDGRLLSRDLERCDRYIRFADFDFMLGDFSRCLRPGGYLAITFSNFRFCDSGVAPDYDVVFELDESIPMHGTPLYDRDNLRMAGTTYREMIFRKRIADEPAPPVFRWPPA